MMEAKKPIIPYGLKLRFARLTSSTKGGKMAMWKKNGARLVLAEGVVQKVIKQLPVKLHNLR